MNKKTKKDIQISFLPWTGLKRRIEIGPIIFWPYYNEADKRIKDSKVKDQLNRYFKSYVDNKGEPVDTITICSHVDNEDVDFSKLDDSENNDLKNSVNVLILTTIVPQIRIAVCTNNNSIGPPSADVFELITQNLRIGNDDIAVKTNSNLAGGLEIGEVIFTKPWATGGNFWELRKNLIDIFEICFSDKIPTNFRERLFRSLEWFRMAHLEGANISILSKVVMMATAFETLLQFPRQGKTKFFVEHIEKTIARDEFKEGTRTTSNGKEFTNSLTGCWAGNFYDLRSRIVHGEDVSQTDLVYKNWITHLIVADLVFWECIIRELFSYHSIKDHIDSFENKYSKRFQNKSNDTLLREFFGFDDVYKALGWL